MIVVTPDIREGWLMLAMTTPDMIFAAGGLVVGIGIVLLYGIVVGRGAKAKAQLILDEAQRNADAKVKDAEVAIKEVQLKTRGRG